MANNFFDLYRLGLSRKGWSCSELSRQMQNNGYMISERSLQRYKRGETLPSILSAEEIFKTLEIEMSREYLRGLLSEQIPEFDMGYEKNRYLSKSLRLRIRSLSNQISDEGQIMIALQKRIAETQRGDNPSFTKYIENLVQKDIDEKILKSIRKINTLEEIKENSEEND